MKEDAKFEFNNVHSSGMLKGYLDASNSEHISLVMLDKWAEGKLDSEEVKQHIERKISHIKDCGSCRKQLIEACNKILFKYFNGYIIETDPDEIELITLDDIDENW